MARVPPGQILQSAKKEAVECEVPRLVRVDHPFRNKPFLQIFVRRCPLPGGSLSEHPCIPRTAILDACEVLTGKKGKLASDREGRELVLADLINGAGRYYYIVEDDYQIDYPVFRSIHEWVPPSREEVPDRWFTKLYPRLRPSANDYNEIVPPWFVLNEVSSESAIVAEVKEMDKRCLLSAHGAPLEAAHVFPAADVTATWVSAQYPMDVWSDFQHVP